MSNKEYFVHESSYVDDGVEIGKGTRIWHFCHIQTGAKIGERCSFGQNVNVSNKFTSNNTITNREPRAGITKGSYGGEKVAPSVVYINATKSRIPFLANCTARFRPV